MANLESISNTHFICKAKMRILTYDISIWKILLRILDISCFCTFYIWLDSINNVDVDFILKGDRKMIFPFSLIFLNNNPLKLSMLRPKTFHLVSGGNTFNNTFLQNICTGLVDFIFVINFTEHRLFSCLYLQ